MPTLKRSDIRGEIDAIRSRSAKEQKAHERREEVTRTIIQHLKSLGTLFKTSEGYFYFDKSDVPRLFRIEQDSVPLAAFINERYGINSAERREFEHLIKGLEMEAHLQGEEVEVRRLAHYDRDTGKLYVSRFDGTIYRLDGRQIREVANGTDGKFFWDDPTWQPYEIFRDKGRRRETEEAQKLVPVSANFSQNGGLSAEDQQWVFSVWCRSQFFGSIHPTKPLLLICGEKGGGKTLALRKWLKFLFGQSADVTALERSKPDGFVAAVCGSPVVVFDNVDEQVSWLADHLAQLATGISFKRRQYYTTNQSIEFQPQCFVALTSRTPKFIDGRDDVLDRTLILQTERREKFESEAVHLRQICETRNVVWTGLLRNLNTVVATLKQYDGCFCEVRFRMADFATFALMVARSEGREADAHRILGRLDSRRGEMLLGQEPVAICLDRWLEVQANTRRTVTSAELNRELSWVAQQLRVNWPYASPHSLGQRLSHIKGTLSERFEVSCEKDSANQNQYRFARKTESLKQPESQVEELQVA